MMKLKPSQCREDDSFIFHQPLLEVFGDIVDKFQAQAKAAGGDGFISKPVNLQKIESIFSCCLKTKKRSHLKLRSGVESSLPGCAQKINSCYANIRVLVAEDNKINQKVMHRMLLRLGLEHIDIVENGREAVDREVTHLRCDSNGYGYAGHGRSRSYPADISAPQRLELTDVAPKILFVTAHALDKFQPQAKAAGGDGFISKPVNLQKIESIFSCCLKTKKRSHLKLRSGFESSLPGCAQKSNSCYANIRVLVAEDNKINQKVMHRMLLRLGLEHIDIVENGQEAVDRQATHTYNVILMDLDMPVMDGLGATRHILARPRLKLTDVAPKIFFVTAHALGTFQAQAKAAGGDGFISKPVNLQKFESIFSCL